MNAMNRTRIANIVSTVFNMDLDVKFLEPAKPFVMDGVFAAQEYNALASAVYGNFSEIIKLQDGNPPTDADATPHDNATPSSREQEEVSGEHVNAETAYDARIRENKLLLPRLLHSTAVLLRRAETVGKIAADELAERQEAARLKNEPLPNRGKPFFAYIPTWPEYITKAYTTTRESMGNWYVQTKQAFEGIGADSFPHISAQQANDEWKKHFDYACVTKVATNAWDKFLDGLAKLPQIEADKELVYDWYYSLDKAGQAKNADRFTEKNDLIRSEEWKVKQTINKGLDNWVLLLHIGAPKSLITSPEFITAQAEKRTREAVAQLAKAKADVALIKAETAEMEVGLAKLDALDEQAAARSRHADVMARLNARLSGTPEPTKAEVPASDAELLEAIKALGVPKGTKGKGNGGIKPVGANGIPSYTHR